MHLLVIKKIFIDYEYFKTFKEILYIVKYIMVMGKIYRAPAPSRGLSRRQFKQVSKMIVKDKSWKVDRNSYNSSIDTSGSLLEVTDNAQGFQLNERSGTEILVKKIILSFSIQANVGSALNASNVRICLVRSKVGPIALGDFPLNSFTLLDRDKFQIYYDRQFRVVAGGTSSIHIQKKFKLYNKRVPGVNVSYDHDESAVSATSNPFYVYMWGSDATNDAVITLTTDMHFQDKS